MNTSCHIEHIDTLARGTISLGLANGCFDIIHAGHIDFLEKCASCNHPPYPALLVAINSDRSVRELKGPTRPINHEKDRARVIAALKCIDFVTIFDDINVAGLIRKLRPKLWFKGGDYTLETLNQEEVAAAKEVGAKIVIIPFTEGYSTTKVIEAMKAS